eukprot:GHVH01011708.1.p1 GENE.GHVH01011708.1~~GHVH01011708.1.p1  ORF type:complete len:425 (+),score=78.51 GHVH01011708.1:328-1602(+)
MTNLLCCRRMSPLPLVVAGMTLVLLCHFMNVALTQPTRSVSADFDGVDLMALNIRGSKVEKFDDRIAKLNDNLQRNVMKESVMMPDHISGEEEYLEKEMDAIVLDDDVLAAGEALDDEESLNIVNLSKVDDVIGQDAGFKRPAVVDHHARAVELGLLIKEPVLDGAQSPDDSMKPFGDVAVNPDAAAVLEAIASRGGSERSRPKHVAQGDSVEPMEGDIPFPVIPSVEASVGAAEPIATRREPSVEESIGSFILKPYVQLDISVDGEKQSPMIFKMKTDESPLTTKNFELVCEGWINADHNRIQYDGVPFHRIIHGFMMQGGSFKNDLGQSSPYGLKWDDEESALQQKHTKKGILSMANAGPNTNSTQFFITFGTTAHLDGYHAVFGELIDGESTLDYVNDLEIVESATVKPVILEKCSTLMDY